jgi:site-specific DNA-methyltransferase (adenine-specific)
MEVRLLNGDCLDKLKELEDNSIDSIVTDPPYGLAFMGKKWDYDVPSTEIWEECIRVLKPGGHLLSFAGSRTYHRMAVRIEDAGFEIRDQIMWIYGSGFPKSHNIGKAVDKIEGNEREVVGKNVSIQFKEKGIQQKKDYSESDGMFGARGHNIDVTKGNSQWEGWGTALKPAHEPIVMARKPLIGTVANNVLEYGVGGLNIDGCRVGNETMINQPAGDNDVYNTSWKGSKTQPTISEGRFPANVIMDEEAGKILDEQSGTTKGINKTPYTYTDNEYTAEGFINNVKPNSPSNYGDVGGASRFFYCPKAQKKDRNEGMPENVETFIQRPRREDGSVIYKETHPEEWNEVMKSKPRKEKTSLGASEEKLQTQTTATKNIHPTVKPTELMKYLVRLVTPKDGVVLDPFMGSGSTGKAAVLEGMNFVGIEREEEYYQIAQQRIEHSNKKNTHTKWFE